MFWGEGHAFRAMSLYGVIAGAQCSVQVKSYAVLVASKSIACGITGISPEVLAITSVWIAEKFHQNSDLSAVEVIQNCRESEDLADLVECSEIDVLNSIGWHVPLRSLWHEITMKCAEPEPQLENAVLQSFRNWGEISMGMRELADRLIEENS